MPRTPKSKKDRSTRRSLMVEEEDYKLLKEVWKANGWSVGDATRRAIHALFAYDAHLKGRAEHQQGEVREVLKRVRREVDPGLLAYPKPMRPAETEAGAVGVATDDLAFFVEQHRLFARREVGDRVEVYEVLDGRLVLQYPVAPTAGEVALT